MYYTHLLYLFVFSFYVDRKIQRFLSHYRFYFENTGMYRENIFSSALGRLQAKLL